jgi:hypothetical protein
VEESLLRPDEWDAVRLAIRGNPLFVFQDSGGANRPQSDGGFAWVIPDPHPHPGCRYLDDFYASMTSAAGGRQLFGSSYQGFDDTLATWPLDEDGNKIVRKLDRRCGRTWLCSFESANDAFDGRNQLPNLQIVTWNDYDEGTEIETGIDNCLALSASIDSGGHVHWVPKWTEPSGTEETIDHYRIFSSPDGENLTLLATVPAGRGPRSLDLRKFEWPAGPQTIFVQAVGKPSIRNHIVNAGTWSPRRAKAAVTPVTAATSAITIVSPTPGATVSSPIHVIADETSTATASVMQIYLDGNLVIDRPGVEHLDEFVPASPGQHQIVVKAWYADGSNDLDIVDVLVDVRIVVFAPAHCDTPTSPIRVIADETTAATAGAMQIYVDGELELDRAGVEHIDELVPVSPGPHQIAVKAWYGLLPGDPTFVDVVVGPTVEISSPAPGAGTTSPIRVIAEETTPGTAAVLQVYLDGTLAIERPGERIDELIPADVGPHQLAVKAWYPSCAGPPRTVDVTVLRPGPPVFVIRPAPGATVSSPLQVAGEENTARTATKMQVEVDEVLVAECLGAQRIDEIVTASTGFHRLTVKAEYADGASEATDVNLFVASESPGGPILVSIPAACATAGSPLRVVADENTTDTAAVMQIYVDGELVVERRGVEHLDESLPVDKPGPHWIAVKAWYDGGCNRVAHVYVTVGP